MTVANSAAGTASADEGAAGKTSGAGMALGWCCRDGFASNVLHGFDCGDNPVGSVLQGWSSKDNIAGTTTQG